MNMVKMSFKDLDRTLSDEEMQELEAAEQLHPVFDADSPEMTADMLQQFKRMNQEDRNKQLFWDENNWQPLCKDCHDRKTGAGL